MVVLNSTQEDGVRACLAELREAVTSAHATSIDHAEGERNDTLLRLISEKFDNLEESIFGFDEHTKGKREKDVLKLALLGVAGSGQLELLNRFLLGAANGKGKHKTPIEVISGLPLSANDKATHLEVRALVPWKESSRTILIRTTTSDPSPQVIGWADAFIVACDTNNRASILGLPRIGEKLRLHRRVSDLICMLVGIGGLERNHGPEANAEGVEDPIHTAVGQSQRTTDASLLTLAGVTVGAVPLSDADGQLLASTEALLPSCLQYLHVDPFSGKNVDRLFHDVVHHAVEFVCSFDLSQHVGALTQGTSAPNPAMLPSSSTSTSSSSTAIAVATKTGTGTGTAPDHHAAMAAMAHARHQVPSLKRGSDAHGSSKGSRPRGSADLGRDGVRTSAPGKNTGSSLMNSPRGDHAGVLAWDGRDGVDASSLDSNYGTGRDIPIKQGILRKIAQHSKMKKLSQKRWVCITKGNLAYYSSLQAYMDNEDAKGSFDLSRCSVKRVQVRRASMAPGLNRPQAQSSAMSSSESGKVSSDSRAFVGSQGAPPSSTQSSSSPDATSVHPRQARKSQATSMPSSSPSPSASSPKRRLSIAGKFGSSSSSSSQTRDKAAHFPFLLIQMDGRKLQLDAYTEQERDEWVSAIEAEVMASLNRNISAGAKNTGSNPRRKSVAKDAATRQGSGNSDSTNRGEADAGTTTASSDDNDDDDDDGAFSVLTEEQIDVLKNVNGNNVCCDCSAPNPDWASINFGVLICIRCSGCHRNIGVHVTRVRSLALDDWNKTQLTIMEQIGNEKANAVLEASLASHALVKPTDTTRDEDRLRFIREKYERLAFLPALNVDNANVVSAQTKAFERSLLADDWQGTLLAMLQLKRYTPLFNGLKKKEKQEEEKMVGEDAHDMRKSNAQPPSQFLSFAATHEKPEWVQLLLWAGYSGDSANAAKLVLSRAMGPQPKPQSLQQDAEKTVDGKGRRSKQGDEDGGATATKATTTARSARKNREMRRIMRTTSLTKDEIDKIEEEVIALQNEGKMLGHDHTRNDDACEDGDVFEVPSEPATSSRSADSAAFTPSSTWSALAEEELNDGCVRRSSNEGETLRSDEKDAGYITVQGDSEVVAAPDISETEHNVVGAHYHRDDDHHHQQQQQQHHQDPVVRQLQSQSQSQHHQQHASHGRKPPGKRRSLPHTPDKQPRSLSSSTASVTSPAPKQPAPKTAPSHHLERGSDGSVMTLPASNPFMISNVEGPPRVREDAGLDPSNPFTRTLTEAQALGDESDI